MRIIDFHTHFFPEKVVEKAMARLTSVEGVTAYTNGTLNALQDSMKEAGIEASLNLPLATSADSTRGLNAWSIENNTFPVFSLGSIHPDYHDPFSIASNLKKNGIKGIKLHPEYQSFKLNEPRMDKIWKACIENDLFVLTHAGGDIAFSPPFKSNPEEILKLSDKFPDLRMVLAHCGSWNMWDEVESRLAGNIPFCFDLAYTPGVIEDDKLLRIISKHGADKILFGTDSPWQRQKDVVDKMMSLSLENHDKELIFFKNAASLLNYA